STNAYGLDTEIYLVAKDTGEWHALATWNYAATMSTLFGPTVSPRMVPGTYDLLYCHQCNSSANISFETDAADAFPRGLRILQSEIGGASCRENVNIEIAAASTNATVTLSWQPLPATNV